MKLFTQNTLIWPLSSLFLLMKGHSMVVQWSQSDSHCHPMYVKNKAPQGQFCSFLSCARVISSNVVAVVLRKAPPGGSCVFSCSSNCCLRWPLQSCNQFSHRRASYNQLSSRLRSPKDGLLIVAVRNVKFAKVQKNWLWPYVDLIPAAMHFCVLKGLYKAKTFKANGNMKSYSLET